ncbi:LysM peptidoglycan-binding domain-containing protein [Streptomyces sp. NPDC088252]|uniref:aggregation-promoting factor C-terminal-like domain-containing protein n=1 Tax=Streptomyces sp. NPDC088252 TaxID=3365845 RepID=UPI003826B6B1
MSRKTAALLSVIALSSLALTGTANTTAHASEKPRAQVTVETPTDTEKQAKPDEQKPASYTIKNGDTLTGIADEHNQKYSDLLGRNKQFWAHPDLIYPGETVRLTGTVHKVPAPKRPANTVTAPKTQTQPPKKSSATHTRTARSAPASGSPRAYARSVLGASQFSCLDALFARESGWNVYATNSSSGAYGIPQALPGSKMASAGADWRTNGVTQVKWGIQYVNSRYGSPCGAWNHFQHNNWY